jgi:hypothetical protein
MTQDLHKVAVMAALFLAGTCAGTARAEGPLKGKIIKVVLELEENHIVVADLDGKTLTVHVNDLTAVKHAPAKFDVQAFRKQQNDDLENAIARALGQQKAEKQICRIPGRDVKELMPGHAVTIHLRPRDDRLVAAEIHVDNQRK